MISGSTGPDEPSGWIAYQTEGVYRNWSEFLPNNSLMVFPLDPYPADSDGWYDPKPDLPRLVKRLVEACIVAGNADPNKCYIFGHSSGAVATQQLLPLYADVFIGGMMAAHFGGSKIMKNLRNNAFAIQIGQVDETYNRLNECRKMRNTLMGYQAADPHGYHHYYTEHEGKGHNI